MTYAAKDFPESSHLTIDFKHGQPIEGREIASGAGDAEDSTSVPIKFSAQATKLYESDWSWGDLLSDLRKQRQPTKIHEEVAWLENMLPSNHEV